MPQDAQRVLYDTGKATQDAVAVVHGSALKGLWITSAGVSSAARLSEVRASARHRVSAFLRFRSASADGASRRTSAPGSGSSRGDHVAVEDRERDPQRGERR